MVWRNLRAGGFAGPMYAVNLKHASLDGVPVYARAADLPHAPDLALLCTPPHTIAPLVAELGALGTRAVIIFAAALDAAQKQAALEAARPHLLRLLGPNCIGLLSPHIGLNASFAHTNARPGELAFVSQSGALATAMLDWAERRGIGFSHLVSVGDRYDVDFGDLLDHLANDADTRAILLYIESVESARKFMSAARAAARNKPVIVVKAGRTCLGGALPGADVVYDAAIRRAGMLRVDTLQELFTAAATLARFRRNRSTSMTIMTNDPGAGLMATDAAARAGVTLAQPNNALRQRLEAALPASGSHSNPINLVGDAPVARYTDTLAALLADASAGAVLFIQAPTAIVSSEDIATACVPLLQAAPSRVMSSWLGDAAVASARALFEQAGVPDYPTPEDAVHAFAMLQTYRQNQDSLIETPSANEYPTPDVAVARQSIVDALAAGREWLNSEETSAVLSAYGVPVTATAQAVTDAAGSDGFGEPPQVPRLHAHEVVVGARIDPVFGPVILCGQGGTARQAMHDRAVALPPLNSSLARELVSRTGIPRQLGSHGGLPLDALCDTLIAVSRMLEDLPQLAELDIDPLQIDDNGALARAARIRLARQPVAGAERFAIMPYPAQWVRTQHWRGGTITVRPIRPADEAQHRRFVENLDPEDVRMRTFQARRELPHSEMARLAQIDYDREMAFIAEQIDAKGEPQTLGVARTVSDPDNIEAEFAVIVQSDLKGTGLGRLLLGRLVEHARSRGTHYIVGFVLPDNVPMLKLGQAMGFEIDTSARATSDMRRIVKDLTH